MIVGIDVSKGKLDIHVNPDGRSYIVENTPKGYEELKKRLQGLTDEIDLLIVEPTGGYEKPLICFLIKESYPVHLCHPTRVHYYAKSKGYLGKTDKIDAKILSEYGMHNELSANGELYLKDMELKELEGRYRRLKDLLASEKANLDKCHLNKEIRKSQNRVMTSLSKEIKRLKIKLEELLSKDELKLERIARCKTVKGVGEEVSRTLIIHLPELGTRSRSTITALAGLAPLNRDSGVMRGYRSIYGGRGRIRKLLYMAILSATRYNPVIKRYYIKLLSKGKTKRMAQVACMRKLLLILNAMLRDEKDFDNAVNC